MTTNNTVNVGLSGSTGTGNFVGSSSPTISSPTFTTPTLGVATATSITFSPTTDGIVGTTTNNNASAGYVGEVISSIITTGSATAITSGATTNLTSINLTAGDWDVYGSIGCSPSGDVTVIIGGISASSVTLPDLSLGTYIKPAATGTNLAVPVPTQRFSLSGSQTVYLIINATFSGTGIMYGSLYGRRSR